MRYVTVKVHFKLFSTIAVFPSQLEVSSTKSLANGLQISIWYLVMVAPPSEAGGLHTMSIFGYVAYCEVIVVTVPGIDEAWKVTSLEKDP